MSLRRGNGCSGAGCLHACMHACRPFSHACDVDCKPHVVAVVPPACGTGKLGFEVLRLWLQVLGGIVAAMCALLSALWFVYK